MGKGAGKRGGWGGGDPLAELARRELSEGDRRDGPRSCTAREQHYHPAGEQRRLSRACGGFDEERRIKLGQCAAAAAVVVSRGHAALQNLESPPAARSNATRLRRSYPGEAADAHRHTLDLSYASLPGTVCARCSKATT